jgi:hypothetical protein
MCRVEYAMTVTHRQTRVMLYTPAGIGLVIEFTLLGGGEDGAAQGLDPTRGGLEYEDRGAAAGEGVDE